MAEHEHERLTASIGETESSRTSAEPIPFRWR